ncbi:uncharacterized protein LOC143880685 [Tasmannia lanceolata]|uniref:uncharacterized protein LOC143880685 n=1 Tax=Tasmannia lanceolata TaxID=3420 RepID=UPI0040639F29
MVWCDVVAMDSCHLLLGRPWQYDRGAIHDGRRNTYSFMFEGVKTTLTPSRIVGLKPKPGESAELLKTSGFASAIEESGIVYVLVNKMEGEEHELPELVRPLVEEFSDVFPEHLPPGLPPMRDVQHCIDLIPGASLPKTELIIA